MDTPGAGSVVVLTALDLEYEAVSEHLTDLETVPRQGTLFECGQLPNAGAVTLALIGEGNLAAAALAERARAAFTPRALLMVGIAGALKNYVNLGDVVVAEKVYAYHGATEEGGDHFTRPAAWEADHKLFQLAHRVSRAKSWTRYLADVPAQQRPVVHFKPVAAGEVLLNSRDTPLARQLHREFNDALAIEMESAGVAKVGALAGDLPVMAIRGISDKADGAKYTADQAGWQPVAAANAAAFALALIAELYAVYPDIAQDAAPGPRSVTQYVVSHGGNAYGVADGQMHIHPGPADTPG